MMISLGKWSARANHEEQWRPSAGSGYEVDQMTAFSGLSRLSPAVFVLFLLNLVWFVGNLVLLVVHFARVIAWRQPESTASKRAGIGNLFTAILAALGASYGALWAVGTLTDRQLLSQLGFVCLNLFVTLALVASLRQIRYR
jgi:hypothetical protein